MSSPVFIAGLSGSGKAQLRLALMHAEGLAIFRKTYLWRAVRGHFGDLTRPDQLDDALAAIGQAEGETLNAADVGPLDPHHPYETLFAAHYLARARSAGKQRWGVQMGGIEDFADEIMAAVPGARFVHLIADPRDHLTVSLGRWRRFRSSRHEAERWLKSAEIAIAHRANSAWMTVRTHDLAKDPVRAVGEVAEFLDLSVGDIVAAVSGIDFAQLLVERRRFTIEGLPPDVRAAMEALGIEQDDDRGKTMVGFRTMSRKGGSA